MGVDKGNRTETCDQLPFVWPCGFLGRKPESIVRSSRLLFLPHNQRSIHLHPRSLFSLIFFHHQSRFLDLVLNASDFVGHLLVDFFQKIQSIDDVLGWYCIAGVTKSSGAVAGVV